MCGTTAAGLQLAAAVLRAGAGVVGGGVLGVLPQLRGR